MRRITPILVVLAVLIGYGAYLLVLRTQRAYALASRTAEYTFVIRDAESKVPIPGATIKIWGEPYEPPQSMELGELTTDAKGRALYVREHQSVEDVIGISTDDKLEGVRQHPNGIGTFIDRFWCTLDINAAGYIPLKSESLGSYEYTDHGYDSNTKLHRFEFIIEIKSMASADVGTCR